MLPGKIDLNQDALRLGSGEAFVEGLSPDNFRMIVMQWIGVGYMLLFLGAVPLALVQFGAFVGICAWVVGICGLALAAVLTVTCFVS